MLWKWKQLATVIDVIIIYFDNLHGSIAVDCYLLLKATFSESYMDLSLPFQVQESDPKIYLTSIFQHLNFQKDPYFN